MGYKTRSTFLVVVLFTLTTLSFGQAGPVELMWDANDPGDGVQGYHVYRSSQSGSGYSRINPALVTGTSYLDSTAPPGDTCYYVCTAVNGEGLESGFSNEVQFTVPAENSAPIAHNDEAETLENSPTVIDVLANDEDADSDSLSVIEVTQGEWGSVAINGDNTVTYSPGTGFVGTDSFVYAISDGNGGEDEATVWVTVNESAPPPNDPPNAVNDSAQTNEDEAVLVLVLGNDTDPDEDVLEVVEVTHGAEGWVSIVGGGTTVRYFPNDNFFGDDSFLYTISDGRGGVDQAQVTVTVASVNDAPRALDDEATTAQNEAVTIEVLSNDSDVDEDQLTVTGAGPAQNGTVKINSGQTITYTPDPQFTGEDSFEYTVSDGAEGSDIGTVFVWVIESNEPPIAENDQAETNEDEPIVVLVLANDSDPDEDPLEVTEVAQGEHGSVVIVEEGTAVRYEPNENFSGSDTFIYAISDGKEGGAEAQVTVTVAPVNDPPVAVNDEAFTQTGEPVVISVLANDSDPDQDVLIVTEASQGSQGSVAVGTDHTITYTPDADFTGEDSFTYSISDQNGETAAGSVFVTVTEHNEPPLAVDDLASTPEDEPVVIQVLENDSDPDQDPLTIREVSQAEHGVVEIIEEGRALRYSPSEDYSGTDSLVYSISDGKGLNASASVLISIDSVNDNPVANDDMVEIVDEPSISIDVLANDFDVEADPLSIVEISQAALGQATINSEMINYTPDEGATGSDSFTYTISDGNGGSASATIIVAFPGENQPPVAVKDEATAKKDKSVNIDLLFNDIDPDNDVLTIVELTEPESGEVTISSGRAVKYTPARGFLGNDSFEYSVSDGRATAKARVNVKVVKRFGRGKKLMFPAYVDTGDSVLNQTFVGVGLLNSGYETDYVSVGGVNSDGDETYSVQLGEPLLPKGQTAFLAEEAIDLTPDSLTLTAEGEVGDLQGFFMIGSNEASRLDGIGSELFDSSKLYFPFIRQTETDSTLLYFVNSEPDTNAEFTLSLHDQSGQEIQSVEGTLAPSGAFLGTVSEIFGEDLQLEEGYVVARSIGTPVAGFELVANEKSLETLAGTPGKSAKELLAPQFFIDQTTGSTSTLRLLNAGNWRARITVEAYDDQANLLAEKAFDVASKELLVEDLKSIFEVAPEELVTGFLKLKIGGMMGSSSSVVGSITYSGFDGRSSTTLPLIEDGDTELIFPHVAQTADASIYTGFSILNPTEELTTVTIEAFDRRGLRTALKQFELEPGTRAIDLLRSETFFGNDFEQMEGHVRIRSTGEVVAIAIFGDYLGNFMSTIQGQERQD